MPRSNLIFIAFLALLMAACQPPETSLSGATQGTGYSLMLVTRGLKIDSQALETEVAATFKLIDEQLSNWRPDSEISRFNAQRDTDWHSVPASVIRLVRVAKEIHEISGGCYDLTIKPLFDLWGFSKHEQTVPTPEAIKSALKHTGFHRIEIDAEHLKLRKKDPEVEISLDSIAQGYTVSVLAKLVEGHGITHYLIEVGGEMQVRGTKADGSPWHVAVEKPTPVSQQIQRILEIRETEGTAIMTSGTYRNFFETKGNRFSHIIDPRTGQPVEHHLLSVTLLHEDATLADALSTALLCVGEKEALRISEAEHLKTLMIHEAEGQLKETMSSAFMASPQGHTKAP